MKLRLKALKDVLLYETKMLINFSFLDLIFNNDDVTYRLVVVG